ncbi:endonuclease MutS2 [Paenibacillus puerhi]|uniref:endonuclease MutS2 n=1 Tax=Paenibacillus puerhi TaxID=2692622 RepID=UPI00135C246B|nr:endonuclease MutS2 [Paenibacillus puerhi]
MKTTTIYNQKILNTLDFHAVLEKCAHHASTSLGQERVMELQPSGEFQAVKIRLQATEEAVNVDRLKGGAPFGGIRNIRSAVHRARIGGMLNTTELLDVSMTSQGGRRLGKFLDDVNGDYPIPLLLELTARMTDHKSMEDKIRQCIDENATVVDSASPELARVRQELRGSESKARERLEQMVRTPSIQKMLQDNLVTLRNDRYVIPVKQEYRGHFGGMIHDQSASGATLFIEPEAVVQMNNRVRELKLKEEVEVEKILRLLSSLVAESADTLLANVEALAELDFIFAKAGMAREMKATLPILNDRGFIKLKRGRHPLIAPEQVVPLDVELGNKFSSIIVTGPNTGGKTVSLKTVGLLSLMAMSGLFVPAEDGSQLCVFDAIYADIGDEQSIEQNLSTFSSHMTNIIRILKEMTPKSLVLLDELGAGTDPAEGSALAISILDYIHRMGCRILATTHYSELKAYAYDRPGVINASMEFDVQTLRPTYRLLVGVPGRSNAFAIASRLGLPKPIIDHARGQVDEEEQRVESMIATLEENTIQAEAERTTAAQLREEVERLREELRRERERFEEQRGKLMERAEREAREAVAKARREAEEVVTELRRLQREEGGGVKDHKISELKRKLNDAVPELKAKQTSTVKRKPDRLEPGDEVLVTTVGQRGHIVELAGEHEVTVQLGILKMKVNKADVQLFKAAASQPKVQQPPKATSSLKRTRDENAKMELDLRGANVEEAILEIDRFLDESYLANFAHVYIIHGKGTGVLRTGVQEYLRRHKHVKSQRLGNYNEGGAGVTVAELK